MADAWIKKQEPELNKPGAVLGKKPKQTRVTLGDAIDRYIRENKTEMGRTKLQVLNVIKSHEIAEMACADVKSTHVVEFASSLKKGVQAQTVSNYLSHLGAMVSIAKAAWGYDLDENVVRSAFKVTKMLGLTSKSKERERRPSPDELDKLMKHFADISVRQPKSIPMCLLIAFAIFSTRRQAEITRIKWTDVKPKGNDGEPMCVLAWDMKHPGQKCGNNVWCNLPDPLPRIFENIPKKSGRIFSYKSPQLVRLLRELANF